jgi:hypothetical protein
MQNEMRDRLIELIDIEYDGEPNCLLCEEASDKCQKCEHRWEYKLADHLIENGVIVPPCKVGDTVYCVDTILKITEKCKVYGVGFFKDERIQLYVDDGECKYVTDNWCNTKEEAEQKLKGGAEQ